METRQIIATGIVVALVCVGAVAIVLNVDEDESKTGTYSFTSIGITPSGALVNNQGEEIIRFSTWTGDMIDLYTAWFENGYECYNVSEDHPYWELYTIEIHAAPGTTITADQIYVGVKPNQTVIGDGTVNPSDYYIRPFINAGGEIVHSTFTNLVVTTDETGHAQMIVCVLTDQHHDYPYIFGSDTKWTCTN